MGRKRQKKAEKGTRPEGRVQPLAGPARGVGRRVRVRSGVTAMTYLRRKYRFFPAQIDRCVRQHPLCQPRGHDGWARITVSIRKSGVHPPGDLPKSEFAQALLVGL